MTFMSLTGLSYPTFVWTHLISFSENDERGSEGGLFVVAVIKESAAANAGILRQDRIMKINGIELNTPEEFIKELIKIEVKQL